MQFCGRIKIPFRYRMLTNNKHKIWFTNIEMKDKKFLKWSQVHLPIWLIWFEYFSSYIFNFLYLWIITNSIFISVYSYFAEHTDLRHVMGLGIAVTRGSAAALSFSYSLLLLTMCRNLITKLRELPIHQYIPLDSHVQFHKVVALTALFFSSKYQNRFHIF